MVKVGFLKDEPTTLAAVGVMISQTPFEEGTVEDLYEKCRADPGKSRKLVNAIMKEHGHMILGDFLSHTVTIEDMSRLSAIYLWRNVNVYNLIIGAGIEASLRVVKPNRYNEAVSDLGEAAFEVYDWLLSQGIPNQDARYVLPEGTLTRMIFSAPPRYLIKLANALYSSPLMELQEIGWQIGNIVQEQFGLKNTQETIPSQWNFWGKESIPLAISLNYDNTVPSLSLNMGVRGSLAMYAQLVRQRLLLCEIEPFQAIANTSRFVIPPTFPRDAVEYYKEIAGQARKKQAELINKKDPNFVYALLLGQEAKAMIYGKGSGVIETSRARSEGVAQWEIRNTVGIPITRGMAKYPELEKEIGPRCWREGRCIEPATFKTKKSICQAFEISGGCWKRGLEELLRTLSETYDTFTT